MIRPKPRFSNISRKHLMGMNQTISIPVSGPIYSNGAAITVTQTGNIEGGPIGVDAASFSITTLSNSGGIFGGANSRTTAPAGAAVSNAQTITTLTNVGAIVGGQDGFAATTV